MDNLTTMLTGWASSGDTERLLFIVLAAGTVFVLALGASFIFLGATDPIRRRLGLATSAAATPEEDPHGRLLVTIETLVGPVSEWVIPSSEVERNSTLRRLTYAGFRAPNALQIFYGTKALLGLALPLTVLFVVRWFPDLSLTEVVVCALLGAAVGVTVPSTVLDRLVDARMRKLRNGFPDALDLLVVCVESGLGLAAAIQRVSDEVGVSHPELARELALVNAEMRAGVDRTKALKNLADRTGLDDIRGLVSLLIQTMRFGTSVADALRVYSEEFRDRRLQKAEEQAAKISTKLIFPLVMCLFPSFFTVMVGPAVIRLIAVFRQM